MSPRPRKRGSKDLPANLYTDKVGKVIYYRYKNPQTGKRTGMGNDRLQAIQAAKQLNQILMKELDLVSKVLQSENSFKEYVEYYRDEVLPARRSKGFPLSDAFLKEATRKCNVFIKELGHLGLTSITLSDISEYLDSRSTAEVFNSHRTLLVQIFQKAISQGRITDNIPLKVIKADTEYTKRDRLHLNEYIAIYHHATVSIQNAMELSLNALQRRTDIKNWRFDYDQGDGYFYIIQNKTRKYGKAAYLRIPTNLPVSHSESGARTLKDLINICRDKHVCPYVIHRMPSRRTKKQAQEKMHMMQLTADQLSKGFAKARNLAGVGKNSEHPPTFHELLGLGEYLREQQGWTIKQIQTLRGHTSEKMTMKYLEGHHWTTVELVSV